MAKDLKEVAQDALDFNKHLDKVFVSADAEVFINKNDAVNHARKLDDKTIAVFERDGIEDETEETEEKVKPMLAADLILLIDKAESEDVVKDLLGSDKRATVKTAAQKRITELKQAAIDEQAKNAEEALVQRTAATGV